MNHQLLIGSAMIVATVVFHVLALMLVANVLGASAAVLEKGHRHLRTLGLLSGAVLMIIGIHTVEVWSWAALLLGLGEFDDLQTALYFSAVTSTTLGYGDVTLTDSWRLLGTFAAMGGLILFGTSTAFLIELMRRLFADSDMHGQTPH